MIKYKKYQNKNDKMPAVYGKWFARAVHEMLEFDEFIEHMANHHCVFSEGTIRGVLIEMEVCLRELLLEGKAVRLDDLGIFTLGISCQKGGAAKAEDFTASMINGCHVNLYLGKRFLSRNLYKDARFKEYGKYIGDGNYYEPDDDGENAASETDNQGGGSQNTTPSNEEMPPDNGGAEGGNIGSGGFETGN